MRLDAAIQGNLKQVMQRELRDTQVAVSSGTKAATDELKLTLRGQVTRAGLGRKLANAWRGKFYLNQGSNAAGLVYTKAPHIIRSFEEGATIRPKGQEFLAIPTEHAPKRGRSGRHKISPANWPEHRFGPLRYVRTRSGKHLLVADGLRQSQGKRGGFVRARSKRALATGIGTATVVMFILVQQARMPKKLSVDRALRTAGRDYVQTILDHYPPER